MSSAVIAVISIAVAAVLFWLAYKFSWLIDEEARFSAEVRMRHRLTDDVMIEEYFRDSHIGKAIPIRVRRIFGHQLDFDFEQIRPDDDFLFVVMDLDCDFLVNEIEETFNVELTDADLASIKVSVRAVAELVQRKLQGGVGSLGGMPTPRQES